MIRRSLQVWCKDARSHLRRTTSLPLPSVNHLCSTKLLLVAELFSRAEFLGYWPAVLRFKSQRHKTNSCAQNHDKNVYEWPHKIKFCHCEKQNSWTEAQITVICSDALQWLKKKSSSHKSCFSFLRSGSVQHHWTEIYHFVEHLAHKFIR